ncbi:MAG: T9SS type A sorting domain-containing protein, partial [Bacteroidia bacterium]|nr:T9SS type A sorting domain-containing protein [Bacteroidia bacterium]
ALSGSLNLPAAGTYYLIIDTWAPPSFVNYSLTINNLGGAPANDLPCNAEPLTLNTSVYWDNSCSANVGEPVPSCFGTGALNTVWFRFVAPASGGVNISVGPGTLGDPQVALYSGTCSALTQISCNQDRTLCGSAQPEAYISATGLTPGQTYFVVVDGELDGTGNFFIRVQDASVPFPVYAQQDCNAPTLVCNQVTAVGDPGFVGVGAYCDLPNTTCLAVSERNTVWYEIRINNTGGTLVFDITPNVMTTDYDFAVYDVTGIAQATACANIASGAQMPISCNYSATSGITGLRTGYTLTNQGAGGTPFNAPIAAPANARYLLVISNYSGNFSGFSLDFFGSPVLYTTTPTTLTWSGAVDTDWNKSNNWGGCAVPSCATDVIIFNGPTNQPVIDVTNYSCRNITIQAGASLTILGGLQLNVCGNFHNDGQFTANNNSTVRFSSTTGAQTISGNLVGSAAFWNLRNSNVTGNHVTALNNIDCNGAVTVDNNAILNMNGNYHRVAGNFTITAPNGQYIPGAGGTVEFLPAAARTYTNNGTLNNVVMNGASTLSLNTNMNIGNAGNLTLTNGRIITGGGFYVIQNNRTPASVTAGNTNSYVQGNLRRFISAGGGNYEFPVGTATRGYQRYWVQLTSVGTIDRLDARFDDTVEPIIPAWLCGAYYNTMLNNGRWYVDAYDVGGTALTGVGNYNVRLYNLNYTNAGTYFTVARNGSITATGNCDPNTMATNVYRSGMVGFSRFSTATSPNPFPVELLNFKAEPMNDFIRLSWTTGSETNNAGFEVLRGTSQNSLIKIAEIASHAPGGNSTAELNYEHNDRNVLYNTRYFYQLRQKDFDGNENLSVIVEAILLKNGELAITMYPNPTKSTVTLGVSTPVKENLKVELYNTLGQLVTVKTFDLEAGTHQLSLDLNQLPVGTYQAVIHYSGGKLDRKVVKID